MKTRKITVVVTTTLELGEPDSYPERYETWEEAVNHEVNCLNLSHDAGLFLNEIYEVKNLEGFKLDERIEHDD